MATKLLTRAPIAVGDKAHAVVTRKSGKARRTLEGFALVKVVAIAGDVYTAEILQAAGARVEAVKHVREAAGLAPTLELARIDLYAAADRDESARFREFVALLYGNGAR